jgi:Probable Zinc-ribbon domain
MPGPAPRSLLCDTYPSVFMEAERAVRSDTPLPSLGTHSNLLVVWRCATCRHEWTATASARGGGCPECAWKKRGRSRAQAPAGRSLLDRHPDVAEEFVRNLTRADMHPADLRPSSQQRCVWCSTCGNRWEATVANRVAGRGCTACANRRRAENVRRPTEQSGTAAEKASFPQSELIANLTDAARGLHDIKPGSTDRCLWRCSDCSTNGRRRSSIACSKAADVRSARCGGQPRSAPPRLKVRRSWHSIPTSPRTCRQRDGTRTELGADQTWLERPLPVAMQPWSRMGDDGRVPSRRGWLCPLRPPWAVKA